MEWDEHGDREEGRYQDGLARLPDHPDARQKQLVRIAMAASGAGLVRLMQGRRAEAAGWFARSAERYRESYEHAPPESWGRLIGALKARLLAGDSEGAAEDARWAGGQGAADSKSSIGWYAAALAGLVLGTDDEAGALAVRLQGDDAFPRPVADALVALASGDREAYGEAVARVLESFETRAAFLEDVPVADTVLVLEVLAERRGLAIRPVSTLLPG